MKMDSMQHPYGYAWRSSRCLIIATACIALLTETLLYGFIVPILPYMLEIRLRIDPAKTQSLTSVLLSTHGFFTVIAAPVIAAVVDKTAKRKTALLVSLIVCMIGTLLVALTITFWALLLGRILQAIAGSAAWIICLAMLTDNAGDKGVGKMMGLSMSFIMTGTVGGPMVAGVLLEWLGYWPAWSVPLGVLFLDIFARLIMIEPQPSSSATPDSSRHNGSSINAYNDVVGDIESTETTSLLPAPVRLAETDSQCSDTLSAATSCSFYYEMLRDVRIWASLANSILYSAIISGFNTTLPVHLRQVFNWGSSSVGIILFIFQVPSIFLGPVSGWIRDLIGIRYPTTIAWVLLAFFLSFLGLSDDYSTWASTENHRKVIFISCMAGIGVVSPLIQGAGLLNTLTVLQDIELEQPKIFGPHGGRSRAFAMNSVGFDVGLMLGPLLSGVLSESIGYYYMNITIAAVCLIVALVSFCLFDSRRPRGKNDLSE